jgi:hypothetical protein
MMATTNGTGAEMGSSMASGTRAPMSSASEMAATTDAMDATVAQTGNG